MFHQSQLRHQTGANVLPQEVILLANLSVPDAQGVLLGNGIEHPADPPLIPAGEPGRFQGEHHAVQIRAQVLLKVIDGVRPKQTKYRHRQLVGRSLGRQVFIPAAGVVDPVRPAAPQGKAVGADLVPAGGPGGDAVSLGGVFQGHGIQHPGTDGPGVPAEDGKEGVHIGIHQAFALLRLVTNAVSAVHPLVKLLGHLAAKTHACLFAQLPGDFPPGGDLILGGGFFQHQLLVAGVGERIVFQRVGGGQAVLPHRLNLLLNGLEVVLYEAAWLLMGLADKVVDIDNGCFFHSVLPRPPVGAEFLGPCPPQAGRSVGQFKNTISYPAVLCKTLFANGCKKAPGVRVRGKRSRSIRRRASDAANGFLHWRHGLIGFLCGKEVDSCAQDCHCGAEGQHGGNAQVIDELPSCNGAQNRT